MVSKLIQFYLKLSHQVLHRTVGLWTGGVKVKYTRAERVTENVSFTVVSIALRQVLVQQ